MYRKMWMILTLFLIAISGAAEITFNRPVVIESNASLSDWAHTGTGTLTDPYIIENLVIEVPGNPYCLFIKNVNKPLVIKKRIAHFKEPLMRLCG